MCDVAELALYTYETKELVVLGVALVQRPDILHKYGGSRPTQNGHGTTSGRDVALKSSTASSKLVQRRRHSVALHHVEAEVKTRPTSPS